MYADLLYSVIFTLFIIAYILTKRVCIKVALVEHSDIKQTLPTKRNI